MIGLAPHHGRAVPAACHAESARGARSATSACTWYDPSAHQ